MKKIALAIFILIANFTVSQEKQNNIQHKIFKANIEENHYLVDDIFPNSLKEIKEAKLLEPYNNSEGKFPKYKSNEIMLNITDNKSRTESSKNINHIAFIDSKVIQKLIETNNISDIVNNEQLFYGDREIMILKGYHKTSDKLNVNYKTASQIEIQIGKNIYRYINKVYKSEIDKTLNNSLNLLAISF